MWRRVNIHGVRLSMTTKTSALSQWQGANDHRRQIVVAFYAGAAVAAATDALSNNSLVYGLGAILLASAAAGWCLADASWRCKPMTWAAQLLTFLFWPIAVPIYLVASRGWRGLGWALLNAVAFFAVSIVAHAAALYLYWGPAAF